MEVMGMEVWVMVDTVVEDMLEVAMEQMEGMVQAMGVVEDMAAAMGDIIPMAGTRFPAVPWFIAIGQYRRAGKGLLQISDLCPNSFAMVQLSVGCKLSLPLLLQKIFVLQLKLLSYTLVQFRVFSPHMTCSPCTFLYAMVSYIQSACLVDIRLLSCGSQVTIIHTTVDGP
jgi:hypothetical protein